MRGCGGTGGHSFNDTAESEFHNFVYLQPREARTWKTTLKTTRVPSGSYTVAAEYMSYAYMIEAVAKLPKVNGLMAKGKVITKPVPVQIH